MVVFKDKQDVLFSYRRKVSELIDKNLPLFGDHSLLRDACSYALSTGGQRYRPSLVFMVSEALENQLDVSFAALGIEFFHTASLVADDLPSMDDDDARRNMPSVHKKFGESVALLASYALIAAGYECIAKNTAVFKKSEFSFSDRGDFIGILALENATHNTGLNGATGGQFMDIAPPNLKLSTLKEILHKKTSSLFEIAFVFGWLFGGGEIARIDEVKHAASHFGLAFQIADDLGDMEVDKESGRQVNVANVFGVAEAVRMFHVEHDAFLEKMRNLNILSPSIQSVAQQLKTQLATQTSV